MEFIKARGTKLVNESGEEVFLKGFGLGGWLLPEGYMWKFYGSCDRPRRMEQLVLDLCGQEYSQMFWKKYRDNYITKWDIKFIARKGFNCVRLPLNSRIMYKREEEGISFIPEEIERLDEFLSWCEECGIYVILDMHGAPGGQTGTNIDDCEKDKPELFLEEENQTILCSLWEMLAKRYANRSCIAGYDLLNEPLPNWFSEYNDRVMPLYRKIASHIRKFDQKHLLILEGVFWATDFSIFEQLVQEPFDSNTMLQFHKYWSCPDVDSIEKYLTMRDKLQLPLLMGEGGENNTEWYMGFFSMLRKEDVSYCFWSYKKMDTRNSPISFPVPKNWNRIIDYIDNKADTDTQSGIDLQDAIEIFNDFLYCITNISINEPVISSMECRAPLSIPAEYYHGSNIVTKKQSGAALRLREPVSIIFVKDSTLTKEPDYKRYGGESQSEEENLCILLEKDDWVSYEFFTEEENVWELSMLLKGSFEVKESIITVSVDTQVITVQLKNDWQEISLEPTRLDQGRHVIKLMPKGKVLVDEIKISFPETCSAK